MFSQKILKAFPPPAFIDFPYAGLSFSDNHIRLIQFSRKTPLTLKAFAAAEVDPGAIVDGSITDAQAVGRALEEIKRQVNKQYKKENSVPWLHVTIPEERGYLFELDLPRVIPKQIRGSIEFKIEENVPLSADKVLFDYALVESESKPDTIKAVVSAIPKTDIDAYLEVMTAAGLSVLSLETQAPAVARSILTASLQPILVAHFTLGKVGLYLVSRGIVRFSSSAALSTGWQADSASVAAEIKKVSAYWQDALSADGRQVPTRIIVCGSGFPENIALSLAPFLDQEVTLANVWINAWDISRTAPEIAFLDSLAYAPAIGAALPSESLI